MADTNHWVSWIQLLWQTSRDSCINKKFPFLSSNSPSVRSQRGLLPFHEGYNPDLSFCFHPIGQDTVTWPPLLQGRQRVVVFSWAAMGLTRSTVEKMKKQLCKRLAVLAPHGILILVIDSLPFSEFQAPGGDTGTRGRHCYAEVDSWDAWQVWNCR